MSSVYLDTDVIISSLISKNGASFEIVNNKLYTAVISNHSKDEILKVAERFNIPDDLVVKTLKKFKLINVSLKMVEAKSTYSTYVLDPNDSHIVAGAVHAKCSFLITFNIKHFEIEKIKEKFGITVIQPGKYLQHLRLN